MKQAMDAILGRITQAHRMLNSTPPVLGIETDNPGDGRRYKAVTDNGRRNVSPRLKGGDMLVWLQGFESALDEVWHLKHAMVAK